MKAVSTCSDIVVGGAWYVSDLRKDGKRSFHD